ncbi:Het domain-containing protein [Rutstroemia sp. NJR-2017a WRK4]|nr:Het domain-containing protein [Rutstroemia sp. NJR-2017a WRK4]
MATDGQPETEPLLQEVLFSSGCTDAANLQAQLSKDRIFQIHAESLLVRRLRLKIATDEDPVFEEWLICFFLYSGLLIVTACCYSVIEPTWRVPIFGTILLALSISIVLLWFQDHLWDYVASRMPTVRWQLFDPTMLSPESRDLIRRLCSLLDRAESASEGTMQPNLPLNQGQSVNEAGYKKFYQSPLHSAGMYRLLVLEAGSFGSPIVCRLRNLSFGQAKYTALSYAWGNHDGKDTALITVNDKIFHISRNLETALRYLRKEKKPKLLWIDAICINQHDNIEKTYQVAAMSDIYHQAKRVVIFLGAGYNCSEFFDFCARFQLGARSDSEDDDGVFDRFDTDKIASQVLLLFHLPWWSRAWVIQELAYAQKEPWIIYGHKKVLSHAFHEAFELIHEMAQAVLVPYLKKSEDRELYESWENLQRKGSILLWRRQLHPVNFSVIDILQATQGQLATNPRDKVFAFVSLMMEPIRTAFAPDYTKSVASVYTRMATYLLSIEKCDRMYRIFPLATELPRCPSWVPDFSAADDDKTHDLLWAESPRLEIGDLQAVVDSGVLAIHGVFCGKINATAALHVENDNSISYRLVNEAPHTIRAIIEQTIAILTQGSTTEETDATEQLYGMLTADAQPPFFTLKDLHHFIAILSQGYPSQAPRLLSFCEQDPVFKRDLKRSIARRVQKMKRSFAELRRPNRGQLIVNAMANSWRPAKERIVNELSEDYERNKQRASDNRAERAWLRRKIKTEAKVLLNQAVLKNTVFTTGTGFAGLGPLETQEEDLLVVLCGIDVAFIARSIGNEGPMVLVGKAWLNEEMVARIKGGIEKGELKKSLMYFL